MRATNKLRLFTDREGTHVTINDQPLQAVGKVHVRTEDRCSIATVEFLVHEVHVEGQVGAIFTLSAEGPTK